MLKRNALIVLAWWVVSAAMFAGGASMLIKWGPVWIPVPSLASDWFVPSPKHLEKVRKLVHPVPVEKKGVDR